MEAYDEKKGICRVCLNVDCEISGGLSLFEKFNDVSYIYEKINDIASIEIKKDDNLPDRICSSCLLALESACNFKQQCERSNSFLRSQNQASDSLNEQYVEAPVKEEKDDEFAYDYSLEYSSETGADTILDSENITVEHKTNLEYIDGNLPTENNGLVLPFKSKAIDLKLECHDCGGSFKSKYKLQVHWKKVHLPQQLICPLFKKGHRTYKSLKSHMKRKTKARTTASNLIQDSENSLVEKPNILPFKSKAIDLKLECHDCGGSFTSKCKLRVHWKRNHLPQQLICPICKKAHKTYKSLLSHMKRKSKACTTASKVHVEGVGRNRIYYCKECDLKSNNITTLMNHIILHSGERLNVCEICGKAFAQLSSLLCHKETHKDVKDRKCEHCGKKFKTRSSWYRHTKAHTDDRPTCNVCGKMYATRDTLREHMKRHSGVKSVTCGFCPKTFYTNSELQNHIRIVHKKKFYTCQKCDYRTTGHYKMSRHRKGHEGNKVPCGYCGTFVDNEQQLILHKKRHLEKNLKCTMCEKKFFSKKSQMVHIRTVHNFYVSKMGVKKERDTQSV